MHHVLYVSDMLLLLPVGTVWSSFLLSLYRRCSSREGAKSNGNPDIVGPSFIALYMSPVHKSQGSALLHGDKSSVEKVPLILPKALS